MWPLEAPSIYSFILDNSILVKEIYEAMRSSDISDPIMTLITHPHFVVPSFKREIKNDSTSNEYRNEGNSAYKNKMYEVALKCYNTALAYAPNMSIAMKLAYSNRSAVLFTLQCYRACLKDINTCITMGCPDDILEKLYKRREQAENSLWTESTQIKYSGEIFFKIPKRHPDIPCASAEIDIIMDTNGPKIVAKTDIKVGTVLALEKVFAGFVDLIQNSDATWISCYHCCKLSFNLFPCEGCCKALFCSKQCKDNCMKEYHNIECQILELANWPITQMVLKAAIKMRNMCKSWDEMIELSKKYVNNKQKINQIKDIYDSRNCTSLLTFNHNVHFMHGMFFNTTIIWSHYISIIDSSGCFFPVRIQDKRYAIRAFARILMHLTIFAHPMLLATNNCLKTKPQIITLWVTPRLGLFPFIGKLKRSCIPNTYSTVINNNTTALVATQIIRAGTELSVSPIKMANVVFHYFPAKALGESIRMLLAFGGQEFEDDRIPMDKWPEYKPKTPFGQMPVLEMNGKEYTQSIAISRYLGRLYGLAGADVEEDFLIDQNVDFLNDIRATYMGRLLLRGIV
ncbi:uncharacterized protein LOC131848938 isoform X2 [Achroia grisella]|uniref:uncharacterized protein LOC131848938 isoform X2 n=1 Tax=Achroia grisella TaxID=688607 RepID=UPI0027D296C6|nr:uncharacterized protein LOC131848938 isoform X2 [Achroia grisella]